MLQLRPSLFWAIHTAGWGLIGLLLFVSGWSQMPVEVALIRNGLFVVLGWITTLGFRKLYQHLWTASLAMGRLFGTAIALSAFAGVGASLLLNPIWAAQVSLFPGALGWTGWFGGALNFSLVFFAWSTLYLGARYALHWQSERERALRADARAAEAQLKALHYQIRPHLLFNVLNSIAALILEKKTQTAYRMVLRLSDVLRKTMDRPDRGLVPIEDEMDYLRSYLDLEQIRFGERLTVRWDLDSASPSPHVPSLLLQPLVENAIKHGVSERETGGTIAIRMQVQANRLILAVADDGPGLPDTSAPSTGWSNLRQRLNGLYGNDWTMEAAPDPELGGLRVRLNLPASGSPAAVSSSSR